MSRKAAKIRRKAFGWVLDLDTPAGRKERRFYVTIADPNAAFEALRSAAHLGPREDIHIARRLSKRSIKLLHMGPGEVRST
jgi:hypothetical protein